MEEAYDDFLKGINVPIVDAWPLDYVLEKQTLVDGVAVECGVFEGRSINKIARALPDRAVIGYDSFEGLPEKWERPDWSMDKGHFSTRGELPEVPANVKLVRGWFDETLPCFAEDAEDAEEACISLLHVDCDLYSSTKTVLTQLSPFFVDGTVIVFDELLGYPNHEKHEILAFYEYLQDALFRPEWLARENETKEEVAVRLVSKTPTSA